MTAPFVEPQLSLELLDVAEQDILIAVQGEDVLQFEENLREEPSPNTRTLPDPVQLFVRAAQLGMFTNARSDPWQSTAEVLDSKVELDRRRQSWRIRVRNIDPRAGQVLANMLQARLLDRIVIKPDYTLGAAQQPTSTPKISEWRFPHPHPSTSVAVDYQPSDRRSRERTVELVCKADVSEFAETIFSGLDKWATLLMLGGYPSSDMRPYESVAVAEPAFLLDPHTIQMNFPNIFLCDENCFAALVNYAQIVHHTISPIERLVIN